MILSDILPLKLLKITEFPSYTLQYISQDTAMHIEEYCVSDIHSWSR